MRGTVAGIALGLHTAHIERVGVGAMGEDFDFTFAERLLIASKALLFYPQKLIAPFPLIFVYPRWSLDTSTLAAFWPTVVLAVVVLVVIVAFRKGVRGPALALAFFAGTLFPALGFFNVWPMRYSFVADHFQYLASLGVLALTVGGIAALAGRLSWSPVGTGSVGAVVLLVFGGLTWRQAEHYRDEETLWHATLRDHPGAWMAHNNLATLAAKRGDHEAALASLRDALGVPSSQRATDQIRFNIGLTLERLGRYEEALAEFERVHASRGGLELKLGAALARLERSGEAEAVYREGLEGDARAEFLLPFGVFLMGEGRPQEAQRLLREAVELHPGETGLRMFLADAFALAGTSRRRSGPRAKRWSARARTRIPPQRSSVASTATGESGPAPGDGGRWSDRGWGGRRTGRGRWGGATRGSLRGAGRVEPRGDLARLVHLGAAR